MYRYNPVKNLDDYYTARKRVFESFIFVADESNGGGDLPDIFFMPRKGDTLSFSTAVLVPSVTTFQIIIDGITVDGGATTMRELLDVTIDTGVSDLLLNQSVDCEDCIILRWRGLSFGSGSYMPISLYWYTP